MDKLVLPSAVVAVLLVAVSFLIHPETALVVLGVAAFVGAVVAFVLGLRRTRQWAERGERRG